MLRLVAPMVAVLLLLAVPSSASAATCDDYSNQAAAQNAGDTRDADGDGIYCEALPCPCARGGSSGDGGEADRAAAQRRSDAAAKRRATARRRAAQRRRAAARRRATQRRARRQLEGGQWRVYDVIDGDTVKVRRTDGSARETVRLIGIDTPEVTGQAECGGLQATSFMLALAFTAPADTTGRGLFNREGGTGVLVELQTDRSQDVRDTFGRALAYVDAVDDLPPNAQGEYDLGKTMLAGGLANVFQFDRAFARQGAYETATGAAQDAGRASWSACPDFASA